MYRRVSLFGFLALLLVVAQPADAQTNGGAASKTIWDGVYTAAQAARGENAVKQNCGACHAAAEWRNAGFIPSWSGRSVGELHTLIRTTMPMDAPGRLSPAQYADIVAYILKINNVPAGEVELPSEDRALQGIAVTKPAQ